jgi:hypothetical protein
LLTGFKENFPGILGEISLINICGVFLSVFGVDKELSCWIGCLFGITGFWSIKIGLGVFSTWGKFSVIGGHSGGSPLSNHFLPARMEPISPSSP